MLPMLSAVGDSPMRAKSMDVGESRPFRRLACFSVTGDADPGLLSRVLEPVAKRGLVIDRVNAVRDDGPDPVLVIDMQVGGLDPQGQDIVAAVLGQVVGVRRVLACEKEDAGAGIW